MPALRWCGRRWRSATDDFTVSSVLFSVLLLVGGILLLIRYKNGLILRDCPLASKAFTDIIFSIGVVDTVGSITFFSLALLSCRGTPFQISKRRHVPKLLYVNGFLLLAMLGLCIALTKFGISDAENRHCESLTRSIVLYTIAINYIIPIIFLLFFVCAYDPEGRRKLNDHREDDSLWWQRFRVLCCNFFQPPSEEDAYMDVAKTFATIFRAHDLVPSDVAAGMFLLHGRQQREHRLRYSGLQYGPADDGRRERLSSQAKFFPHLTDKQLQQVRELGLYSRFYMGAYGWLLYEYMHCCLGVPKLCCFDPKMCCRHHPGFHRGTTCFCDLTMLLKTTGIDDDDVILTSWENTLFSPVFYVAIDRATNAIVVAIRGTMSLADCVTDFAAFPNLLQIPEDEISDPLGAEAYYVHGGMKRSAEYVLRELVGSGVMDRVMDGDLSNHNLVVLGHSLGAGVASILSIMLWSTRPSLRRRLRCLAYSPPGGLLSSALVAYSKSFMVGCFAGTDMIPRISLHTVENLRESIFDVLAFTNLPKTRIFLNSCNTEYCAVDNPFLESRSHREVVCRAVSSRLTENLKLYPPGNLIHYCKAVVRACCSGCLSERCFRSAQEDVFVPIFESPEDVQVVICSPSMFTDHFPDRLFDVINDTERRLNAGDLDRFFASPGVGDQTLAPACHRNFDIMGSASLV